MAKPPTCLFAVIENWVAGCFSGFGWPTAWGAVEVWLPDPCWWRAG